MRFWRRNKRKNSEPKIAHIEHLGGGHPGEGAEQYVPYSQQKPGAGIASTRSSPTESAVSTPTDDYQEYMASAARPMNHSPANRSPLSSPSYGSSHSSSSMPPTSPQHAAPAPPPPAPSGPLGGLQRSLSRSRSISSMDFGPVSQPTLSATLAAVRNPDSFMIPDEEIFTEKEHEAYSGMVRRQATLNRKPTRKGMWASGR